ncbi:hypothetical protein HUJ04_010153 [Dendroctonus ponderosae]|nr:hypothetical protein HUJ04_010153 [Dendroctonus ponderosae]
MGCYPVKVYPEALIFWHNVSSCLRLESQRYFRDAELLAEVKLLLKKKHKIPLFIHYHIQVVFTDLSKANFVAGRNIAKMCVFVPPKIYSLAWLFDGRLYEVSMLICLLFHMMSLKQPDVNVAWLIGDVRSLIGSLRLEISAPSRFKTVVDELALGDLKIVSEIKKVSGIHHRIRKCFAYLHDHEDQGRGLQVVYEDHEDHEDAPEAHVDHVEAPGDRVDRVVVVEVPFFSA